MVKRGGRDIFKMQGELVKRGVKKFRAGLDPGSKCLFKFIILIKVVFTI